MSANDVLKTIKDKDIEYVDLRFTDPRGKLQHVTMDAKMVDDEMLNEGIVRNEQYPLPQSALPASL